MKLVYFYADSRQEWNCSEWRCAIPARAINKRAGHAAEMLHVAEFAGQTPRARAACRDADIIVVQRLLFGQVLDAIQYWRARGKAVVADFDDAYDLMPPSNPGYRYWGERMASIPGSGGQHQWIHLDRSPLDEFRRGLRLVSAATAPSRQLVADWLDVTSMFFLPNYLDLEKYTGVAKPARQYGEVVVGWGGGGSHQESLRNSGILEALGRVCQQRSNVRVVIAGADPQTFAMVPVPEGRKTHLSWVPFQDWPKSLAQMDIGLAPLYGEYDQRRSWIKAAEYMAMRIPWVASRGVPYAELQEFGLLVENTPEAWASALLQVVDNLPSHRALAEGPGSLQAQMMGADLNAERIVMTYEDILDLELGHSEQLAAGRVTHGTELRERVAV